MTTLCSGSGVLALCRSLFVSIGRRCKTAIADDRAEREWFEMAWAEAMPQLKSQRMRHDPHAAPHSAPAAKAWSEKRPGRDEALTVRRRHKDHSRSGR